jgi:hypothetical protein
VTENSFNTFPALGVRRQRKSAPWPVATKLAALQVADQDGPTAAARESGVPRQTIQQW